MPPTTEKRIVELEENEDRRKINQLTFPLDHITRKILSDFRVDEETNGLGAAARQTISPRLFHTGNAPPQVSTDGTDQTPVATEVYICELFVPCNVQVTGLSIMNGTVASGNIKVGLADSSGLVKATSASTGQSGTDAYQRVPFTSQLTLAGPATYFSLMFIDNTTGRLNTHTFGDFATGTQTSQTFSTGFTNITVPTTFTTAIGTLASLY